MTPTTDKPFELEGETLLRAVYYGNSMSPTLKSGDQVLLRKHTKLPAFTGEIFMIQLVDDQTFFCRPRESNKVGCIFAVYDNPNHLHNAIGFDFKEKYIVAYWELVASQRIHSFSFATVKLPIFQH
jgi:hypothetical protein